MLTTYLLKDTWKRLPAHARETVTYFSKVNEKLPASGQSVKNAHRLPLDKETVGSDQQLANFGIVWDLWASQMTGVTWGGTIQEPKHGDVLNDSAGNRYYVQSIDFLDMRQRYRLTCIRTQAKS